MKDTRTNFQLVCDMNVAFGNPKGDPHKIDGKRLLAQCKNILAEYIELMGQMGIEVSAQHEPFKVTHSVDPTDEIRDALCDIHVFAYGAHHFMGYDADKDMRAVVEANFSRFCSTPTHLEATQKHFDKLGVKYYVEGDFPTVCLKSAEDQQMPEYPKGKFLKALGYSKPVFYQVTKVAPISKTEELRLERVAAEALRRGKQAKIEEQVTAFRVQLETEAFGIPDQTEIARAADEARLLARG